MTAAKPSSGCAAFACGGATDTVWEERGSEHAAEVMVWGLIDRQFSARIPHNSCAELLDGYTTLTGQQPLHGFTGKC